MTLLLMNGRSADTQAALEHLESALFNLRTSAGYAKAKKDNPNVFQNTRMGRAETDIKAAVTTLGGTP